jgi:hypothetical protein
MGCCEEGSKVKRQNPGPMEPEFRGFGPAQQEEKSSIMTANLWSEWQTFPDPRSGGILHAPFGPGCCDRSRAAHMKLGTEYI